MPTSNARFTVVTPNYNMGAYLAQTIESVLSNLRSDDEYFVIDGGSTDESVEILRHYASRLTGWVSEADHGYSSALEKGFRRSTAEYQCWINTGDLLLPGALDEARAWLQRTGADLIFGDDLYVDEIGEVLQVSNGRVADLASMMIYGGWTPLQDACFWHRDLYERVGGVDPSVRYAADYDLFLRMSLCGRSAYVPVIFSAFRRHPGQTSARHATSYRKEREHCRLREMKRLGVHGRGGRLKASYYRWGARLRARLIPRNRDRADLVGSQVSGLPCMPAHAIDRSAL
ncbi:MAG: glycosyltransferase family 2 protein [Thiobacillaceae bacterium]